MAHKYPTKSIILLGFGVILTILALLTGLWLSNSRANSRRLADIVKDHNVSELVFIMRDAAHTRALALYRMGILKDPFDQDEEYLFFRSQAERFIKARDKLLASGMSRQEEAAWEKAQPLIKQGSMSQNRTVDLILDGKIETANKLLLDEVMPTQNRVMDQLTEMLDVQKQQVDSKFQDIVRRNANIFVLVSLLSVVALGVGVFIAWFVIRTTGRNEREIVKAREEALIANQHKSVFLANMSHELRTPLNAVIGYSEMLEEEAQELGQESFVADLGKISTAGCHLLTLINGVLDLSKIESGKMEVYAERFLLSSLIKEVDHTIRPVVGNNQNEIQFIHHATDKMFTDKVKLRQSLHNLISNACKFTKMGRITVITEDCLKQGIPHIAISVSDTGIGIAEDKIETLFKPFHQADLSTTREYGGTGLGLSISKCFCNMMGGDIIVQSRIGEGSTFTIMIPRELSRSVLSNAAA